MWNVFLYRFLKIRTMLIRIAIGFNRWLRTYFRTLWSSLMKMEPSWSLADQFKVKSSSKFVCRTLAVVLAFKIKKECSSFSGKYKALNHWTKKALDLGSTSPIRLSSNLGETRYTLNQKKMKDPPSHSSSSSNKIQNQTVQLRFPQNLCLSTLLNQIFSLIESKLCLTFSKREL